MSKAKRHTSASRHGHGRERRSDKSVADEVRVALEQARQDVKPLVKRERAGEVVPSELLHFRLKRAP